MVSKTINNFPQQKAAYELMMLRKANKDSLRDLSDKTGLSIRAINFAELERIISLKTILLILQAYDIHPLDFFTKIYE